MYMTKATERKLIKSIKGVLGDNYKESDDLLITELVDWIKISNHAKDDLQESVKHDGTMSWQALTTISMSSKAILATLRSLGIIPSERNKSKIIEKKMEFDIKEFLED